MLAKVVELVVQILHTIQIVVPVVEMIITVQLFVIQSGGFVLLLPLVIVFRGEIMASVLIIGNCSGINLKNIAKNRKASENRGDGTDQTAQ